MCKIEVDVFRDLEIWVAKRRVGAGIFYVGAHRTKNEFSKSRFVDSGNTWRVLI